MSEFKVGGAYNWKNQPERLTYMGLCAPSAGRYHQFSLVDKPGVVWCEVAMSDLDMIEETPQPAAKTFPTVIFIADSDDADYDKYVYAPTDMPMPEALELCARLVAEANIEEEKTDYQTSRHEILETTLPANGFAFVTFKRCTETT